MVLHWIGSYQIVSNLFIIKKYPNAKQFPLYYIAAHVSRYVSDCPLRERRTPVADVIAPWFGDLMNKKANAPSPAPLTLTPYGGQRGWAHLCLLKSKSNRLQWHLSHTFFFTFTALSCGSNWCPWLFIRLLTFQAVSYDSQVGVRSPQRTVQRQMTQAKRTEDM